MVKQLSLNIRYMTCAHCLLVTFFYSVVAHIKPGRRIFCQKFHSGYC